MRETRRLRVIRQPPAPQSEWKFETKSSVDEPAKENLVESTRKESYYRILEDITQELEITSVEIPRPRNRR
ncbi:MAG: hypothetical protein GY854_14825 [Deltaproteobacteria bacterium]|nr:hypothetical protein [Deltaproteobacteria bacterium]